MTAVGIILQCLDVPDQLPSQWIEMNVAYQFGEITVPVTDDRFVTILK